MILHTATMTDTLSWSASAKQVLGIPRQGYITDLNLYIKITYETSSGSNAVHEDNLANILSSIRIATAGRDFYNVNDGRLALYLARMQYQDQVKNQTPITTASQTGQIADLLIPIHLGLQPYNVMDKTVVIPAVDLPSLDLEVTWGAATALNGTGYTVTAATLYLTYTEMLLQRGETINQIIPAGIFIPRMNAQKKAVSADYTNLSLETDVPVGDILSWMLVMVEGSTSLRNQNLVTEVGFKFPKEAQTPYRTNFPDETFLTRKRWALSHDYDGVTFLPLSLISGKEMGYDLSGYQVGDAKIAYTVVTGDSPADSGNIYQLFYNVGR